MKKPAYRAVWIELLLEATHNDEEKYTMWKGEKIKLKAGQLTVGCKQLSEWTGVPRGTVQRILKCFETESQMSIETSNQYSLISILNWGLYQPREKKVSNEMGKERVTNEQPMGTPKEVNNKEDKNISFDKFWDMYGKKKERPKCELLFSSLSDDEVVTVLQVVGKYVASTPDKKFRKYPSTWLRNRCWEDEIDETEIDYMLEYSRLGADKFKEQYGEEKLNEIKLII